MIKERVQGRAESRRCRFNNLPGNKPDLGDMFIAPNGDSVTVRHFKCYLGFTSYLSFIP